MIIYIDHLIYNIWLHIEIISKAKHRDKHPHTLQPLPADSAEDATHPGSFSLLWIFIELPGLCNKQIWSVGKVMQQHIISIHF